MNQQERRGKAKQLEGRVKEAAGIVSGNAALEREGSGQRVEGAIEEGLGHARRRVGALLASVAKTIDE